MSKTRHEKLNDPLVSKMVAHAGKQRPLGRWDREHFVFNSEEDAAKWRQLAYRQSVNHEGWEHQWPVDERLQATFDEMPELAEGRYFRGADGRHRPIGSAQRETPEIDRIRRHAFSEFANSGVTWSELGAYDPEKPHPGEETALASMAVKADVRDSRTATAFLNKTRDMNEPVEKRADLVSGGRTGLDFSDAANVWGLGTASEMPEAVLVANNGKNGVVGMPKNLVPAQPFQPAKPIPSPGQRRAFLAKQIGKPANDNRHLANDNAPAVAAQPVPSPIVSQGQSPKSTVPRVSTAIGETVPNGAEETDPEWIAQLSADDRLFNWARKGYSPPAPSAYAVYAAMDEGRFSHLEEMKDDWSRLVVANPEAVFRNMQGEVEALSNSAQKDFVTGHHRQPNAAEIAEINDAVERIVFAPAERWSQGKRHLGGEPEQKPYIGIMEPTTMSAADTVSIFSQAAEVIKKEQSEDFRGRPGNKETQDAVSKMMEKLAVAIKACGGKITGEFYGRKEKFLPSDKGLPGSSWPDGLTTFEYNGRSLGVMANHSATYADGVVLKPNEFKQIEKWGYNIGEAIKRGNLEVEAVGVGYFSKKKKKESMEDYLKRMDEFVSKMINCKRPFLIKVKVKKVDALPSATNQNTP